MKHVAQRLSAGHYLYRGVKINRIGYHSPDRKVVWEAVDENENGFAHSYSLRDTKLLVDADLDK